MNVHTKLAFLVLAGATGCAQPVSAPPPKDGAASPAYEDVGPPEFDRCITKLRPDRPAKPPVLDTTGVPAIVSLQPGESACFEAELQGKELRPLKLVDAPPTGGKYIAVSFGKARGGPTLVVRHSEDQPVRYIATLVVKKPNGKFGLRRTSTCAVRPGAFGAELWQEPIEGIVLGGFRPTDDLGCHE